MKKTVQKQITIERELYEALSQYMTENGIKLSALVQALLSKYMKDKSAYSKED